MKQRGWNESAIDEVITNPTSTRRVQDARHLSNGEKMSDPATAYVIEKGTVFFVVVRSAKSRVLSGDLRNR